MGFMPTFGKAFQNPVATAGVVADTRLLWDTFTGAGALTAHTPEIYPVGSSWAIKAGTFANLSGGELPYTTGHHGVALIDIGVTEFDAVCTLTAVAAPYHNVGLCVRSLADATNRYLFDVGPTGSSVAAGKYTAIDTYTGVTSVLGSVWPTIGVGEHTLRIIAYGSTFRVGIDGLIYIRTTDASYTGTYIGPGCYWGTTAGMKWNSLTVYSLPTFGNITVLGDSISTEVSGVGAWPNWSTLTMWNTGDGYYNQQNHAVSGQSIVTHMAAQVAAAAGDTPSMIFVALGTNDPDLATVETIYAAQLQQLCADHPGVPIYCMNILPRTGGNRAANNPRIAAAIITAQSAGVNATLWDTDLPAAWIDPVTDTTDGLHPNATGSWKVANEALSRLP